MSRRVAKLATSLLAVAAFWATTATGSTGAAPTEPSGAPAAASGAPAATPSPSPATVPVEVTLITGDHVFVSTPSTGRPTATVVPADPDHGASFSTRYDGDDMYVIPTRVARLVPSVLDRQLFDVTALARMGYDDESRASIPLIVQNAPGVRALNAAPTALQTRTPLPSIGGEAVVLPKSSSAAFGSALSRLSTRRAAVTPAAAGAALGGASHIWLDAPVTASDLDANLTRISAPAAWDSGLSGAGVKVAVLDTGVDAGHPDLTAQVVGTANFTTDPDDTDDNGHGTHVTSLVAGTGAMAAGARRGVAYGAHVIVGKVLDGTARGQESWVIAGMQWAVAQGADVVSMSLGSTPFTTTDGDPVVDALESLTASSGTLFVVAAGNDGSKRSSVQSPGVAPSALTVGATNADDTTAYFSSRGPALGDGSVKPDIAAPGVNIIGAKAGARTGDVYTTMSGTSQATPQVAGAAALLMQQHPDWSGQQVKTALIDTADPSATATVYDQGAGRLDLARATAEPLSSSTADVDFGLVRWPDRAAQTRQVTITNPTPTAATLSVASTVAPVPGGPSTGAAAAADPVSPVTLSTSELTVPANGSASFTVTLDPNAAEADQLYTGQITIGADGTPALNLPVGFRVEPERYSVTVTVLDRHGRPDVGGLVNLINGDLGNAGSAHSLVVDANGRATARLAPGFYGADSRIETYAADGSIESVTYGGDPEVHVTGDTTLTIDARDARPIQAPVVPHVATRTDQVQLYYNRLNDHHSGSGYQEFPLPEDITSGRYFIQPTAEPVQHGVFAVTQRWRQVPIKHTPQADLYDLMSETPTVPAAPSWHLTRKDVRDLARLDVSYHALGTATTAPEMRGAWSDVTRGAIGAYRPVELPSRRIELVSAAPNLHYLQTMYTPTATQVYMFEPDQTYRPGEHRIVHWLRALHPDVVEAPRSPTSQMFTVGIGDGQHSGRIHYPGGARATTMTMSRNGTPVGQTATSMTGYFAVPADSATLTADEQLTLDNSLVPGPPTSHTSWTFASAPSPDPAHLPSSTPPIVKLDYQPMLDTLDYARAHLPMQLGLHVQHQMPISLRDQPWWTPLPDTYHDVRLSYSTDHGTSWHPLHVIPVNGGSYLTIVPGADLVPGATISLHGTATDADGNAIDQTVIDLIRVRG